MPRLERFRAGQAISADRLNEMLDELERLGKWKATPPLHVRDDASGFEVSTSARPGFWIKLTSGGAGGKYAWTEQVSQAGGGWADGAASGTTAVDPAYEASLSTTVPANKVVWAEREKGAGELRFAWGSC